MNRLPKAQDDSGVSIRGKARMLQTNLICTDSKLICAKETLVIGGRDAGLICFSVAERNHRLRYQGAAAVAYSTLKSRSNSRSLSASTDCADEKKAYDTPNRIVGR